MFSVLLSIYMKENPLYLKQSLDSIFSQTLFPTEVVLVKDGPLTSELEAVISDYVFQYSNLKVIPLAYNQGLGKALNEGLKHCSYELVARMDTDDVAKPERFQKQINVFHDHPDIDVCGAWVDEFNINISNVISTRRLPENHVEIAKYAQIRNPMNHPVVMFKKKAVLEAGGYKHFPLFEDYYLWIRMLLNGAKFYNIQESLLYFRFSSQMFNRRGGWKYALDEVRFEKLLLDFKVISPFIFLKNILTRFPVRIAPNKIRSWMYTQFLRN